jgi:hypothetical protein
MGISDWSGFQIMTRHLHCYIVVLLKIEVFVDVTVRLWVVNGQIEGS